MRPPPDRRPAYTLLELVVVLAIVGLLVSLLLSAVQAARAAAARIACGNNLRQLSLAAHQHHDALGRFPSAVRTDRPTEPMPHLHWAVRLLPHLDQDALWRRAEADAAARRNPFVPRPHALLDVVLPVLGCPSDWRVRTAWTVDRRHIAVASYLGVAGTRGRAADGVLYADSRTTLTAIPDGASNTLLLGERPPSADLRYGWWYAGSGQDGRGTLDSSLGVRERNRSPYPAYRGCGPGPLAFAARRPDDPCGVFHFWSPHPGGANFAFADGSVRFLRYDADAVLPALATRAGGESATTD